MGILNPMKRRTARHVEEVDDLSFIEDERVAGNPGYYKKVIASPRRREAAIAALRMILGTEWQVRLIGLEAISNVAILQLVGLDELPRTGKPSVDWLRRAGKNVLRRLEARPLPASDALGRNIHRLAVLLKLSPTEQAILRLAVVMTRSTGFTELFSDVPVRSVSELIRVLAAALQLSPRRVKSALADDRILRSAGFFARDPMGEREFNGSPFDMEPGWMSALTNGTLDERSILRQLLRIAPKPALTTSDFAHVPQAAVALTWLRDALARRRRGVNILLYGVPGTGKTEFARACASALDATLFEVPNEDREGDPISGRERFGAYAVCQRLLAHGRRQVLLFDEVEDVFGGGGSGGWMAAMFGGGRHRDAEGLRKSWVNEVLESNPAPTIWACNSIEGLDPAYVRRFDLVVEFRTPGRAIRRRMIDRYFKPGTISEACSERLAGVPELVPAQVERVARVATSLRTGDISGRDNEVETMVRSSLRAMGHTRPLPLPALPDYYEPAFINADRDLNALAQGLRSRGNARICLYGVPGTGKTAFAHHLGRVLDKPVIVRRASDLLSMWVGATEQQIAAAFERARDDDAILVIDEADSFLRDRASARASWEVTQVNELLTQMEAFDGLFIASTNLVDSLDAASLRRFDFKVRFDYLMRDQRRAMLERVCAYSVHRGQEMPIAIERVDRLEQITPGDFANVMRQLHVTGETAEPLRVVQLLATEVSMKPDAPRRPIGFSPRRQIGGGRDETGCAAAIPRI